MSWRALVSSRLRRSLASGRGGRRPGGDAGLREAEGRGLAGRQRDRLRGAFAAKSGAPSQGQDFSPQGRPHLPRPAPLPGSRPGARRSWFDVGSGPLPPRNGSLHEGRDLLDRGCAYCTKVPPTWSTPNPPRVAPHPRAVQASHHPSEDAQPKQHLSWRRATTIRSDPLAPDRCLEMQDALRWSGASGRARPPVS